MYRGLWFGLVWVWGGGLAYEDLRMSLCVASRISPQERAIERLFRSFRLHLLLEPASHLLVSLKFFHRY